MYFALHVKILWAPQYCSTRVHVIVCYTIYVQYKKNLHQDKNRSKHSTFVQHSSTQFNLILSQDCASYIERERKRERVSVVTQTAQ